jgi:hypothetical protein
MRRPRLRVVGISLGPKKIDPSAVGAEVVLRDSAAGVDGTKCQLARGPGVPSGFAIPPTDLLSGENKRHAHKN